MMTVVRTGEMSRYLIVVMMAMVNKTHIRNHPTTRNPSKEVLILTIPPQITSSEIPRILLDDQNQSQRDQEPCNCLMPMGDETIIVAIVIIFRVTLPSYLSLLPVVSLDFLRKAEDLHDTMVVTERPCNSGHHFSQSANSHVIKNCLKPFNIFYLFFLSSPFISFPRASNANRH